jgi:hypothetical protein
VLNSFIAWSHVSQCLSCVRLFLPFNAPGGGAESVPGGQSEIQTPPYQCFSTLTRFNDQNSAINPVAARNTHRSVQAAHRGSHDTSGFPVSICAAALARISLTMSSLPTAGPSRRASGNRPQQEPPKVKRYEHHCQGTDSRCRRTILIGLQYVIHSSEASVFEQLFNRVLSGVWKTFTIASNTAQSWRRHSNVSVRLWRS